MGAQHTRCDHKDCKFDALYLHCNQLGGITEHIKASASEIMHVG